MTTIRTRLLAFWQARQPRERRAMLFLACALIVLAAVQLMWTAHAERTRLRAQLPRLTARVEAMRAAADEWRLLAALPEYRVSLPDEEMRRNLERAAKDIGLAASWKEAATLHLQGQAQFDAWIRWLGQLQQDHRLHVLRARVQATAPGLVMIDADLGMPMADGGR